LRSTRKNLVFARIDFYFVFLTDCHTMR